MTQRCKKINWGGLFSIHLIQQLCNTPKNRENIHKSMSKGVADCFILPIDAQGTRLLTRHLSQPDAANNNRDNFYPTFLFFMIYKA